MAATFSQGGGSSSSVVYFQETQPTSPGPWVWYKLEDGVLVDIVVETGA